MIQYPISRSSLENLIEQERPGWLARAASRTAAFKAAGKYEESSSIWSEVKSVYMRLQHGKCAYCERQLESEEIGKIEHDLEHFRPKKKAKPWRANAELVQEGVSLTQPVAGSSDPGYHLLAYHAQNYCTSCKSCNSALKRDYFPIEGPRNSSGEDPPAMGTEMPYLVNPVGNFDDSPEDLIGFNGLSPIAKAAAGFQRRRGLVTIKFFRLDDRRRKYLFRERAYLIVSLHSFLQHRDQNPGTAVGDTYGDLVQTLLSESSPHSNCARSFNDLYVNRRQDADEIFQLAADYLQSISN